MEQDKSQVSPKTLIMSEQAKENGINKTRQDRTGYMSQKSLIEGNGENWQNTKEIYRVLCVVVSEWDGCKSMNGSRSENEWRRVSCWL